ncbi:MAG: T9SS type A sorting domain-containing protein [Bacteroidia bacterium]|nr:T9SS type A sorting domain-containing protein [Bacteroidia bacterium]
MSYTKKVELFVFLFIVGVSFYPIKCHAQMQRAQWRIGYNGAGPATIMDFRSGHLRIDSIIQQSVMNFEMEDASLCDNQGNFLCYSNGIYIADATHDTMMNGNDINPGFVTNMWYNFGLPTLQGAIILPDPGDTNQYYLFYASVKYINLSCDTLFMAKMDMSMNNGLGAVIIKHFPVRVDSMIAGQLTAVKHANGRDWWLVLHGFDSDIFYLYLITPAGISPPKIQHIGCIKSYAGEACFSPDGKWYASYDNANNLEIMGFDRCTGTFSKYQYFDVNETAVCFGCAFSYNSRFLYVCAADYLYQFDMTAQDIFGSVQTVATYDSFTDPLPTAFITCGLAFDNKIYITGWGGVQHLSVINSPDILGVACDVQQHAIALPGRNSGTIPNYPFYELGSEDGSICDTLILSREDLVFDNSKIIVFPNPVSSELHIRIPGTQKLSLVELYDLLGQRAETGKLIKASYENYSLNVDGLNPGQYILIITTGNKVERRSLIKN